MQMKFKNSQSYTEKLVNFVLKTKNKQTKEHSCSEKKKIPFSCTFEQYRENHCYSNRYSESSSLSCEQPHECYQVDGCQRSMQIVNLQKLRFKTIGAHERRPSFCPSAMKSLGLGPCLAPLGHIQGRCCSAAIR